MQPTKSFDEARITSIRITHQVSSSRIQEQDGNAFWTMRFKSAKGCEVSGYAPLGQGILVPNTVTKVTLGESNDYGSMDDQFALSTISQLPRSVSFLDVSNIHFFDNTFSQAVTILAQNPNLVELVAGNNFAKAVLMNPPVKLETLSITDWCEFDKLAALNGLAQLKTLRFLKITCNAGEFAGLAAHLRHLSVLELPYLVKFDSQDFMRSFELWKPSQTLILQYSQYANPADIIELCLNTRCKVVISGPASKVMLDFILSQNVPVSSFCYNKEESSLEIRGKS